MFWQLQVIFCCIGFTFLLSPYSMFLAFLLCWWILGPASHTYMLRIHSVVLCMGPCCFLLCLIQLFKAQSLNVKLHAFSPFFSLPRSSPYLYVYALSAYSNASVVCVSGSSAWPSCQNSPLSYFSPGCHLSNTSNTNTRLTNIPCKMFSLPLYMQYVNNEKRIYYS